MTESGMGRVMVSTGWYLMGESTMQLSSVNAMCPDIALDVTRM